MRFPQQFASLGFIVYRKTQWARETAGNYGETMAMHMRKCAYTINVFYFVYPATNDISMINDESIGFIA